MPSPMTSWDHKGIMLLVTLFIPQRFIKYLQHARYYATSHQGALPSKSLQSSDVDRLIYYFSKYRCYDGGMHRVQWECLK